MPEIVGDDFPVLHITSAAIRDSTFADAARSSLFGAVFAVVAIFACVAWIAAGARGTCMNLRRVPDSFDCRRVRDAPEGAHGYYSSDDRNCFHGRIVHLALSTEQSKRESKSAEKEANCLNELLRFS